ncbi:unnamed protein product [Eruca vesicaria subsp. sativa]|uniref:Uncharacterized protein n=1 Tax=Eruca vesicaria subsp. sativa TaxID=29727 RepID=A0ABC8LNP7_ERUVS|nr:unnamed protein product [Eruca vesicaria subsp. sativa]
MDVHVISLDLLTAGNECNYFSWFDEEEGTLRQTKALIKARDEIKKKDKEIEKKDKEIEKLNKTIEKMNIDLEKKQMETMNIQDEDDIVRKFEECYV